MVVLVPEWGNDMTQSQALNGKKGRGFKTGRWTPSGNVWPEHWIEIEWMSYVWKLKYSSFFEYSCSVFHFSINTPFLKLILFFSFSHPVACFKKKNFRISVQYPFFWNDLMCSWFQLPLPILDLKIHYFLMLNESKVTLNWLRVHSLSFGNVNS